MKGLFQCPPWASPWVITYTKQSPCKGKSFVYLKLLPFQGVLLAFYLYFRPVTIGSGHLWRFLLSSK